MIIYTPNARLVYILVIRGARKVFYVLGKLSNNSNFHQINVSIKFHNRKIQTMLQYLYIYNGHSSQFDLSIEFLFVWDKDKKVGGIYMLPFILWIASLS